MHILSCLFGRTLGPRRALAAPAAGMERRREPPASPIRNSCAGDRQGLSTSPGRR
ncbi:hypothetical protein SJA_C1-26930 [Sphingobium indicum UT26S]|uniref:Uncharacterized protein n=1 Tax=Sphingobium indicum (strain DSM 16413 / CCM 7287 / MTCC 6362 / UT26 / NBRC 101211 / UT26S) TaxID=452662 RepID=D4Z4J5_SPHIU|nr:hypothetical protein SJA_C1-26930 [Sphingobium indicum UT26S]